MTNPLVSICIPTYNRAEMVGKAIESAIGQTYQNIEVLVVDNASQDNIEYVIKNYQDTRLKFYRNIQNLGMYGNFNRCIELSKGKYIHILHSDDFIDSNFTKNCVEFMESHPHVMMTFGMGWFLSNTDKNKVAVSDHDIIFTAPEGFRKILETGNPIICPSVMIHRDVYDTMGIYSCEYPYAGDFYQWLRISRKFNFAYVANAILYYRQGNHSESFQLLQKTPLGYLDYIKIYFRIIEELGEDVTTYRRELNISIRGHMFMCLNAGIWQSDFLKPSSALIFIGFTLNLWTLIKPDSIAVLFTKFLDFIYISIVEFSLLFPGGIFCLRKLLQLKHKLFSINRHFQHNSI